jgi:cysteine-S-conjugate beta-lyase
MPTHPYDSLSVDALRGKVNAKWTHYGPEVLPLWVAEMDFPLADAVKEAIRAQAESDNLGYCLAQGLPGLVEALQARLGERFGLGVPPEAVRLLGSTVQGLYLAVRAFAGPGDEALLLTPLYPPFKAAVESSGRVPVEVPMVDADGGYAIDFDALEEAVTPATRLLMLCNPHNPVGRVYTERELTALAELALRHNLWIVSDELHADLLFDGRHRPIAGLGDEIAARTLTLYGPSKAFNIPGLRISFAISHNPGVLERIGRLARGVAPGPNVLAQAATIGAYTRGGPWFDDTLAYLDANRAHLAERVANDLTGVRLHTPQATYLAWLDFRAAGLGDDPAKALLEHAKVGLNSGLAFGRGGEGFARLNFATGRAILDEALTRIADAVTAGADR